LTEQENEARHEESPHGMVIVPTDLWREAYIRALDERTELQVIVARALEAYLRKGGSR
jgi:hypothetical protein